MDIGDGAAAHSKTETDRVGAAGQRYSLRLEAHKRQLPLLHEFVEGRRIALNISTDAVYDVLCAVTEIVTNTIVHGYAGLPGAIDVEIWTEGRDLYVRVYDQAPAFDPTCVPIPDLTVPAEARPPGGMGIHIARRFTDNMIYRSVPQGGNELTLVRNNSVEQGEA